MSMLSMGNLKDLALCEPKGLYDDSHNQESAMVV